MNIFPKRRAVLALFLLLLTTFQMSAADWEGEPPLLKSFAEPDYKRWLPNEQPSPQTAQKLNEIGFDAYAENNLTDAAMLWKAALLMDSEHYLAHYNYAAVLSIFANGFGDFDARADAVPYANWGLKNFYYYRDAIILHLKKSIALRPRRLQRLKNDEDFDSIRNLEAYRNVLMGPNPSIEDVLREAPDWYSLQAGAFLPKDRFNFRMDGTMSFTWDTSIIEAFPDAFEKGRDDSFTGTWEIVDQSVVITTETGKKVVCTFKHVTDEMGFIESRILVYGNVRYGDYDAHFWEGQDA